MYRNVLSEKTIEQTESISDAQMTRSFLIKEIIMVFNRRQADLEPLLPLLVSMIKKRGVIKGKVYEFYLNHCTDGYKSSSFWDKLNQ